MIQAIIKYKKFKDFKLEVAEGCIESLHLGFLECKKKVTLAFPSLDLKDIVESDNEGEQEEEEEAMGVRVEAVNIEEVALEEVVEAKTVDSIIAKVVVDAEAMASEATKNLEAT